MPIHDFKCSKCGKEKINLFFQITSLPLSCDCGGHLEVYHTKPPMVSGDLGEYTCPVTGSLISGRKAHEENLKKQGCRVLESGEREAMERRKRREEEKFESDLEITIGRELSTYSPQKLEKLGNELDAGATLTPTRI